MNHFWKLRLDASSPIANTTSPIANTTSPIANKPSPIANTAVAPPQLSSPVRRKLDILEDDSDESSSEGDQDHAQDDGKWAVRTGPIPESRSAPGSGSGSGGDVRRTKLKIIEDSSSEEEEDQDQDQDQDQDGLETIVLPEIVSSEAFTTTKL